jgi:glycosyltransferase involved in cell wall biosynthesis
MKEAEIQLVYNAPTPHAAQLFQAMTRMGLPVEIHFTAPSTGFHFWRESWTDGFPCRFYKTRGGIEWKVLRRALGKSSRLFITFCWQDRTSELIILLRMLLRRPYAFWNDTPDMHKRRGFWKRHLRSWFLRMTFRKAHAVMGSGQPALEVLAQMGAPWSRLVNCPFFIDLGHFSPRGCVRETGSPMVFGSCGRLHPDKGFDLALRSLARVFADNKTGFEYRIASAGPAREALETVAAELGIRERVKFLDWVQQQELPEFYRGLDIYLHPARKEPYGVVILESMACGNLVIASDHTCAAIDRISDGENGFLHTSEDVADLERAIRQVMSLSAADQARVRAAARRSAEQWPTERGVEVFRRLVESCG